MGASLFLNVVTIGAGVLMICVACSILYNKYHDIADELRETLARRRQNGTMQQQQQQEVTVEKDVEAAVPAPSEAAAAAAAAALEEESGAVSMASRTKRHRSMRLPKVPTVESRYPDLVPPVEVEEEEEDWKREALEIAARRQAEHPTSFLYHPQQSYQRRPTSSSSQTENQNDNNNDNHEIDVDSFADSCSCYLDNSPTKDMSLLLSKSTASGALNTTNHQHQGLEGVMKHHPVTLADDISCMDYSVDSSMMEPKESFSSFAKPNQTMMMMDYTSASLDYQDTTTDAAAANVGNNSSSRLSYSPFGKSRSILNLTTRNHLEDVESVETSIIPSSVATSNNDDEEESDQYSMVKPSVLTFPSRGTSDATNTKGRMVVHVSPATEMNVSPLRTTAITAKSKNSKSALAVEIGRDDGEEDSYDSEDREMNWKKTMTNMISPDTVSTTEMWSPSSDPEFQETQSSDVEDAKQDAANDSFASNDSSCEEGDAETLQVIQREARNECFAPFYASHSVHVCKSATCTTCRNPQQNEPIFLNATKTSTGETYNLSRLLPKRWWTTQKADDVGKFKDFVSSALLAQRQQQHSTAGLNSSMESHPFDEA